MRKPFPIDVIKIGGSVLTEHSAYRSAAQWLQCRLRRYQDRRCLVVVSAQEGETDRLDRLAQGFSAQPHAATLDLLWSTGELRSAALLALALQGKDVQAKALNVSQSGLLRNEEDRRIEVRRLHALSWLSRHQTVVVPGFFAATVGNSLVSLGRGGSDLSAVLLADRLQADGCHLVKDVPGYFDRDPNRFEQAQHLPRLDFPRALAMAEQGCLLVQPEALREAARRGVSLTVRSLDDRAPRTLVSGLSSSDESPSGAPFSSDPQSPKSSKGEASHAIRHKDHPRQSAL